MNFPSLVGSIDRAGNNRLMEALISSVDHFVHSFPVQRSDCGSADVGSIAQTGRLDREGHIFPLSDFISVVHML